MGGRARRGGADVPHGTASDRVCARCGRRMPAGADPDARWCSGACRSRKLRPIDRELEAALRTRLAAVPAGSTMCPSEVARAVGGEDDAWRALMEPTRQAARRLVAEGVAQITQRGQVVDPSTARGPIRIRPVR